MPYKPYTEERDVLETALRDLVVNLPAVGDLTWAIAVLQDEWVAQASMHVAGSQGLRYSILQQAEHAATDAAAEFRRQVKDRYEDQMRARNGTPYHRSRRLLPQSL